MSPRFLQIHTLTSFPASLLNRDDAGLAKRMPFGGVERTRISSQCLKRHWRKSEGPHRIDAIDGVTETIRSRVSFERRIVAPLVSEGANELAIRAVVEVLMDLIQKGPKKALKEQKADAQPSGEAATFEQVVVFGEPELDYLRRLTAEIASDLDAPDKNAVRARLRAAKDLQANIQGIKLAAGLDAALFGRMVTSDVLAQGDAAVHVAHALTVHANAAEPDYFSVVDDLVKEAGEAGSGHVNTAELTAGVFYGYVVVDVQLLVDNLAGDRAMAAEVVRRLVHLIATESPGAKKGSTAPYALSHLVLVEAGDWQPRTLANAFLRPVKGDDVIGGAYRALGGHLFELDEMYAQPTERRLSAMGPVDALADALRGAVPERGPLAATAEWLAAQVK